MWWSCGWGRCVFSHRGSPGVAIAEEAVSKERGFLPAPELLVPTDSQLVRQLETSPAATPGWEPGWSRPWEVQGSEWESPHRERLLHARVLWGSPAHFCPACSSSPHFSLLPWELPADVPSALLSCSSLQTCNWFFIQNKPPSTDILLPSKFISAGKSEGQPLPLMQEHSSSGRACAGVGKLDRQPGGASTAAPVALLHLSPRPAQPQQLMLMLSVFIFEASRILAAPVQAQSNPMLPFLTR